MKNLTITILFIAFNFTMKAQDFNELRNHEVSADFGSYRKNYLFAITNLNYNSPVYTKFNLKFSCRIRSYGTLYFVSNSAYDFTPQISYYTKSIEPSALYFSAGIGLDARTRMVKDERSLAVSSIEPLISLGIHSQIKNFNFHLPIWSRFYSNGNSITLLPEVSFRISGRFKIYLRDELSFLSIYKNVSHEFMHDIFLGTHFLF